MWPGDCGGRSLSPIFSPLLSPRNGGVMSYASVSTPSTPTSPRWEESTFSCTWTHPEKTHLFTVNTFTHEFVRVCRNEHTHVYNELGLCAALRCFHGADIVKWTWSWLSSSLVTKLLLFPPWRIPPVNIIYGLLHTYEHMSKLCIYFEHMMCCVQEHIQMFILP